MGLLGTQLNPDDQERLATTLTADIAAAAQSGAAVRRGAIDASALHRALHDPQKRSAPAAFEVARCRLLGASCYAGMRATLRAELAVFDSTPERDLLRAFFADATPSVWNDALAVLDDQEAFATAVDSALLTYDPASFASGAPDDAAQNDAALHADAADAVPPNPRTVSGSIADTGRPVGAPTPDARPLPSVRALPQLPSAAPTPNSNAPPYRAFTRRFDVVTPARGLLSPAEARAGLREIKAACPAGARDTARAVAKVRRLLMTPSRRQPRTRTADDGTPDLQRLAQLFVHPEQPPLRRIVERRRVDTAVCLLIDNSGSMRGRPITTAAGAALLLGEAIEQGGGELEILGFTTRDWRGGDSRKTWEAAGKPPNPGRLNDLRHIVYKSFRMPLRRCHLNIAAMRKDSLLKENIDGEALLFAASRLLRRNVRRRILIIVSDGAPADDSTLSVNDALYLDRHLRTVIDRLQRSPICQAAVGIGHDVRRYYPRAVRIENPQTLPTQLPELLATLLQESPRAKMTG